MRQSCPCSCCFFSYVLNQKKYCLCSDHFRNPYMWHVNHNSHREACKNSSVWRVWQRCLHCLSPVAVFQSLSLSCAHDDVINVFHFMFWLQTTWGGPFLSRPRAPSCRRRWSPDWFSSFRWRLRVFHDWTGMYDRAETLKISAPEALLMAGRALSSCLILHIMAITSG